LDWLGSDGNAGRTKGLEGREDEEVVEDEEDAEDEEIGGEPDNLVEAVTKEEREELGVSTTEDELEVVKTGAVIEDDGRGTVEDEKGAEPPATKAGNTEGGEKAGGSERDGAGNDDNAATIPA